MKQQHELTQRQIDILSFIHDYQADYGFVPTIREIGGATGIHSTSSVSYQINRLVRWGYISKVGEVSRGIVLMPSAYNVINRQVPDTYHDSRLFSELRALRSENRRIREQYETRIKDLEHERNQLSQALTMLKYREVE